MHLLLPFKAIKLVLVLCYLGQRKLRVLAVWFCLWNGLTTGLMIQGRIQTGACNRCKCTGQNWEIIKTIYKVCRSPKKRHCMSKYWVFDRKIICKFVLLLFCDKNSSVIPDINSGANNFAVTSRQKANAPIRHSRFDFAPVNAPVPSPFPRKIYCDIMKSNVLNTYVTVYVTTDRCIACRLLALAPMHLPSTVT